MDAHHASAAGVALRVARAPLELDAGACEKRAGLLAGEGQLTAGAFEIAGFHVVQNGEQTALDRLTPLLFNELRRITHRQMAREYGERTLQTTALVEETANVLAIFEQTVHRDWRLSRAWLLHELDQ